MHNRIFNILAIALIASGCAQDRLGKKDSGIFVPQPVTVDFSVSVPEPAEETKALGETPEINSLHVAVFNELGYLTEYAKAEFTKATSNNTEYGYKVELTSSEKARTLHFIANGPDNLQYGSETTIIRALSSKDGQDAYWQKISLSDIRPEDSSASVLILEPVSKAKLAHVKLIRNFSKLTITANPLEKKSASDTTILSNFELLEFRLINVPNAGSIAPYSRTKSNFVSDYQNYSTPSELLVAGYEGYEPSDTEIDTRKSDPVTVTKTGDGVYTDNCTYLYEREANSPKPTYVLIKGYYYKDGVRSSSPRYYKVSLRDKNEEGIALLRNYNYRINILQVLTEGSDSWDGAMSTFGSGEISTSVEAEHLTNVSNGKGRMFVEYTSKTLVKGGKITVRYKFIPDESKGQAVDNSLVAVSKDEGNIIKSFSVASSDDADQFRTITLDINDPTDSKQVQTLYVIGTDGDNNKVQRKINYVLMPLQDLMVECSPEYVKRESGSDMQVNIKIPGGLPTSMFPLELKIEASNNTLTTNNSSPLPVRTGKSICPDKNKRPAFYYLRTITLSEYTEASETIDEKGFVSFPCYFKTNTAESASYVCVNNEYFNYFAEGATSYASLSRHYSWDQFFNYSEGKFTNLKYKYDGVEGYVPARADEPFTFTFDIDCDIKEIPDKIRITLTGAYAIMSSQSNPHLTFVGDNVYEYDTRFAGFSQTGITLNLKTASLLSNVDVALKAERIEDNHLSAKPRILIKNKILNLLGKIATGENVYVFSSTPTIDMIDNASTQSLIPSGSLVGQDGKYYNLPDIDLTGKDVNAGTKLWFAYKNSTGYYAANYSSGDLLGDILDKTDNYSYNLEFNNDVPKKSGTLSINNINLRAKETTTLAYTYNGASTGADISFSVKESSSDGVATITKQSNGTYLVTAKKAGTVKYHATIAETISSKAAECDFTITVTRKPRYISVSNITMLSNATKDLNDADAKVIIKDNNGNDITSAALDGKITYTYTPESGDAFKIVSDDSNKKGKITSDWGGQTYTITASLPQSDEYVACSTNFTVQVNKRDYKITLKDEGPFIHNKTESGSITIESRTDDANIGSRDNRKISISIPEADKKIFEKYSASVNAVSYTVNSTGGHATVTISGEGDHYYNAAPTHTIVIRRIHWVRVTSVTKSPDCIYMITDEDIQYGLASQSNSTTITSAKLPDYFDEVLGYSTNRYSSDNKFNFYFSSGGSNDKYRMRNYMIRQGASDSEYVTIETSKVFTKDTPGKACTFEIDKNNDETVYFRTNWSRYLNVKDSGAWGDPSWEKHKLFIFQYVP